MAGIETPKTFSEFPIAIVKSMVGLATSGFGVVVALAWNEFIQSIVKNYIDPYLGKNSGVISQLIYAILMTILAVVITMQLAGLQKQLEGMHERVLLAKKNGTTPTTKKNRKNT